jgi:glycosyltransferase involved in cell wall biosynthesis
VTVYGEWPDQPAHVIPFFTSVLEEPHMDRARRAAPRPRSATPTVLFVGRLTRAKNVDVLLSAFAAVRRRRQRLRLVIVGDGPERARLEAQARTLGVEADVTFSGGVSFDRVIEHYEDSDVLVLASDTEGWPKAITEAMAFGLVCIGSDCGLVPRILGGGRGIVVPPRDAAALAESLHRIAAAPDDFVGMRARAAAWAQQYSIDTLRTELDRLLAAHWGPSVRSSGRERIPGEA